MRPFANLADRVNRSGVHITGLHTYNGGLTQGRKRAGAHTALLIHRDPDDAAAAQAQQAKRLGDGGMGFLADDHGQGWRAEEAVGFHIPPQALQHRRAGLRVVCITRACFHVHGAELPLL